MMLSFRKNGEVVMLGQVKNKFLDTIELPDDPRMSQGYSMRIVNNEVIYEKPVWMQNKEKKDKLIDEITEAKDLNDLKSLLLKIV